MTTSQTTVLRLVFDREVSSSRDESHIRRREKGPSLKRQRMLRRTTEGWKAKSYRLTRGYLHVEISMSHASIHMVEPHCRSIEVANGWNASTNCNIKIPSFFDHTSIYTQL